MDGIIMQTYIKNIESYISHLFKGKDTTIRNVLETTFYVIFDVVQELYTFSGINNHVWSSTFWSIVPYSLSIIFVPAIIGNKSFNSVFNWKLGDHFIFN